MSRGHEDWFINTAAFGKAMSDMGELGARFGIPYSFTRSGKVIYSDGFEASLSPWQIVASAGYGTVELDNTQSFRGANCAKFTPNAAGLQLAALSKTVPYIVGGKIGIEALVAAETQGDYAWLVLGVRKDDVFTYYMYYLAFHGTELEYRDTSGNRITALVIGGNSGSGGNYYSLMKMVVDPEKGEYDYIQLNNVKVDLSGIGAYSFPNVGVDNIIVGIRGEDTSGDQGIIYFDDVTVTVNEP